jgi:hypothetical protein
VCHLRPRVVVVCRGKDEYPLWALRGDDAQIAVAGPLHAGLRVLLAVRCELWRRASASQRPRGPVLPRPSPPFHRALPAIPWEQPPTGPDWVHEIKHDGYRLMARRGPVGIRFERLREPRRPSTCSMVKTCGASRLTRKAATFARGFVGHGYK